MTRKTTDMLACLAAILLVGGAAIERCTFMPPADATVYHRGVAAAVAAFPHRLGDWLATDVPVPVAATKVLRSNTVMSRSYVNVVTGYRCSFLLIHCSDARDLLAHYPPVCYPGQGWSLVSSERHDWQVGGRTLPATVYDFARNQFESGSGLVSANAMLLPDGTCAPTMAGIEAAARDPYRRHYGAAQLQVVFDGAIGQSEREQVVQAMLDAHRPLFDVLQSMRDQVKAQPN